MKQRIGKFYMTTELAHCEIAPEIFKQLEFVPLRVEHLSYRDAYEYIGISSHFAQAEIGHELNAYEININSTPSDEPDEPDEIEVRIILQ